MIRQIRPAILMILVMTVEQRRSWIIGDEIDLDCAVPGHIDRVFHHARGRLVALFHGRILLGFARVAAYDGNAKASASMLMNTRPSVPIRR